MANESVNETVRPVVETEQKKQSKNLNGYVRLAKNVLGEGYADQFYKNKEKDVLNTERLREITELAGWIDDTVNRLVEIGRLTQRDKILLELHYGLNDPTAKRKTIAETARILPRADNSGKIGVHRTRVEGRLRSLHLRISGARWRNPPPSFHESPFLEATNPRTSFLK